MPKNIIITKDVTKLSFRIYQEIYRLKSLSLPVDIKKIKDEFSPEIASIVNTLTIDIAGNSIRENKDFITKIAYNYQSGKFELEYKDKIASPTLWFDDNIVRFRGDGHYIEDLKKTIDLSEKKKYQIQNALNEIDKSIKKTRILLDQQKPELEARIDMLNKSFDDQLNKILELVNDPKAKNPSVPSDLSVPIILALTVAITSAITGLAVFACFTAFPPFAFLITTTIALTAIAGTGLACCFVDEITADNQKDTISSTINILEQIGTDSLIKSLNSAANIHEMLQTNTPLGNDTKVAGVELLERDNTINKIKAAGTFTQNLHEQKSPETSGTQILEHSIKELEALRKTSKSVTNLVSEHNEFLSKLEELIDEALDGSTKETTELKALSDDLKSVTSNLSGIDSALKSTLSFAKTIQKEASVTSTVAIA